MTQKQPSIWSEIWSAIPMTLIAIFILVPLLVFIAVITTDIYRAPIGRVLGVTMGDVDHLRIYNAVCWKESSAHRVNLLYWSRESAPLVVEFEELEMESAVITSEAGIQQIDFVMRDQDECPTRIRIEDRSRDLSVRSEVERVN